jgi:hypothetical protein
LRDQLLVLHDLKERMLLRRSDESGAMGCVLPEGHDVSRQSVAFRASCESSVEVQLLLRGLAIEVGRQKHNHQLDILDIELRDLEGMHC